MNARKKISKARVVIFEDCPGGPRGGESFATSLKGAINNLTSAEEAVKQAERAARFSMNKGGCWESQRPVDQAVAALAGCDDDAIIEALGYFDAGEAEVREAISEYKKWNRIELSEWQLMDARLAATAAELVFDIFSGQMSVEEIRKSYSRAFVEVKYLDKRGMKKCSLK